MIKIVKGSQLKGNVKDLNEEYFYGKSGRKTEEEYKQLLIDSKKYFDGIEDGSIKVTDDYFIYAPEFYLTYGIATDIAVVTNDKACGVNARLLFIENPIKVKQFEDGYIFASSDGRHRYAVAQKYNLKLLVDVLPVDEFKTKKIAQTEQKRHQFWVKLKDFLNNMKAKI